MFMVPAQWLQCCRGVQAVAGDQQPHHSVGDNFSCTKLNTPTVVCVGRAFRGCACCAARLLHGCFDESTWMAGLDQGVVCVEFTSQSLDFDSGLDVLYTVTVYR